jgi:uncharacterized protein YecE (DUF72 family)
MTARSVLIGTRGFDHAAWADVFYPPELPDAWRFCFYSNRLRSVLIPADAWTQITAVDVRQWVDDSDGAFRFVLEPPAIPTAEAARLFLTLVAPLGTQLAGLLVSPETARQEELARALRARAPVCIGGNAPPMADLARVWHTDTPFRSEAGPLLVALARTFGPRPVREILETLATWQRLHDGQAALFFDDPVAAYRFAEQARTLAEFMNV